jgi:hypothetical protein
MLCTDVGRCTGLIINVAVLQQCSQHTLAPFKSKPEFGMYTSSIYNSSN